MAHKELNVANNLVWKEILPQWGSETRPQPSRTLTLACEGP